MGDFLMKLLDEHCLLGAIAIGKYRSSGVMVFFCFFPRSCFRIRLYSGRGSIKLVEYAPTMLGFIAGGEWAVSPEEVVPERDFGSSRERCL